ncbi:MAG: ArsA family ATPase [Candidatus Helarchaeota archaeon]
MGIKRVVICTGKGGVGKTTISAATALKISEMTKEKTIVASFDIAHNLSDIFGVEIGDKVTQVSDYLYVIEPDPDNYIHQYTDRAFSLAKATIYDLAVTRLSPTLKNLVELLVTTENVPISAKQAAFFQIFLDASGHEFSYVFGDFPPTGSAKALLEIPVFFIDELVKKAFTRTTEGALTIAYEGIRRLLNPTKLLDGRSPLGDLFTELREIKARGERLSEILTKYLSLRLVCIPEHAAVMETVRANDDLKHLYCPDVVYMNKIISDEVIADNKFLKEKREEQEQRIKELEEMLPNMKVYKGFLRHREPITVDGLRMFADDLYGNATVEEILGIGPPKKYIEPSEKVLDSPKAVEKKAKS